MLGRLVRGELGPVGSPRRAEVEAWLRLKELERTASSAASADLMARDALRIASKQKTIAIAQIVVSTITAVIVVFIGSILSSSPSTTPKPAPAASAPPR